MQIGKPRGRQKNAGRARQKIWRRASTSILIVFFVMDSCVFRGNNIHMKNSNKYSKAMKIFIYKAFVLNTYKAGHTFGCFRHTKWSQILRPSRFVSTTTTVTEWTKKTQQQERHPDIQSSSNKETRHQTTQSPTVTQRNPPAHHNITQHNKLELS